MTNKSEYSERQRMYWDLAIMISNHIEEHLHQARSEAWDAAIKHVTQTYHELQFGLRPNPDKETYLSQFK